MKAFEFESIVGQSGNIVLPPEVADEIPVGKQLRVLVMWEPSTPDSDGGWRAAAGLKAHFAPRMLFTSS